MDQKVLIVNPNYPKNDPVRGRPRQPLSLAWISAILKNQGFQTKLIDLPAEGKDAKNIMDIFGDFDYLITTSSTLDRWETPFLNYFEPLNLIKSYKGKKPNGTAILTGAHGTMFPARILNEYPAVDFIVLSEPEKIISNLFLKIKNQSDYGSLAGLALRINKTNRINSRAELFDLDWLPIPDYYQLPMEKYEYLSGIMPKPFTIMETSRGCPFGCNFCFKEMHGGRTYRCRSVAKVIEEIEFLVKNFGIRSIYFQDLEFTFDRARVQKICDQLIKKDLKITWACASRIGDANEELLKLMKQAGCVSISFGVESLSQKILKNINKQIILADVRKAYLDCRRQKINFNIFYTEGHLGEDKETIEESLKNAFKLGVPHPLKRGPVTPYFGTELYRQAVAGGVIPLDEKWENLGKYRGRVLNNYNFERTPLTYLYYFLGRLRVQLGI